MVANQTPTPEVMEPAEGNSVPQPVSMLLEEGSTANAQAESDVESRVVTDVSNRHPMITRSKNEIVKPKVYVATADDETREPVTIQQALQLLKWTEVVMVELEALHQNGT
ncbi:hypothetical protein V6N11_064702 [Hibiscus sabdariffa]|uniref:Uncharacterized protein n=1 Tax=Hibiscus sabdariffa TaxID=183260 RepID=A0ABR2NBC0_9ROSI